MNWLDALRLAASGLRGGMVRTILTILGLGVGVGAVLAVLTLGDAGEERVEKEIARLGVDKVWIRSKDNRYPLNAADAVHLYQATAAPACAGAYAAAYVRIDDTSVMTQIAGYDASMTAVHAPKLREGRLFIPADYHEKARVCLVDQAFAERLEKPAVGRWLAVGMSRFRIVGVIKGMMMQSMAAGSGLVILPLEAFLDTLSGEIAEITISVQPHQQTEVVARTALKEMSSPEAYRADTLENEIDAAREVVRIFVMVLVCVAAVCMLSGGIGVMNVLLVSVRERRREIGLIKAIGGTAGQVGAIFLLEAAAYALLGGGLGVILGAEMTSICSAWIGLEARMSAGSILGVLAAAALLGCGFGVMPAVQAARMEPVQALRSE